MIVRKAFTPPPYNKREILRYSAAKENEQTEKLLNECIRICEDKLSFLVCYRVFKVSDDIKSCQLLKKYLDGCQSAVLFAATLGTALDRLISKYSKLEPSKALMLQAIGAERIESLCDAFEKYIACEFENFTLCPRISPGYSDWDLSDQKKIFAALDCAKNIGLSLNESLMMSPSKSVSAIIGLKERSL